MATAFIVFTPLFLTLEAGSIPAPLVAANPKAADDEVARQGAAAAVSRP
jgi:hypothetical protein